MFAAHNSFFSEKIFHSSFPFHLQKLESSTSTPGKTETKNSGALFFCLPWSRIARAHSVGHGNKPSGKWMGKWSPSHPCRRFKWSRSAVSPDSVSSTRLVRPSAFSVVVQIETNWTVKLEKALPVFNVPGWKRHCDELCVSKVFEYSVFYKHFVEFFFFDCQINFN